jgi:hypothetical protein
MIDPIPYGERDVEELFAAQERPTEPAPRLSIQEQVDHDRRLTEVLEVLEAPRNVE